MKIVAGLAFVACAALVALSIGTLAPAPAEAQAEAWSIDPAHSFVMFRIKHMDLGYAYGRWNEFSGSVSYDEANAAASSVTVEVKAASVDTGVQPRDDHLRSPDFFNVAQFPTIAFKSTSVAKVDAKHVDVTGDLTLHGVTKPLTVRMEKVGGPVKDPVGKMRMGFEGTATIQRLAFGVGEAEGLSDEVRLTLAFEVVR
jgi:polyisoprenoid-binding protein YceI